MYVFGKLGLRTTTVGGVNVFTTSAATESLSFFCLGTMLMARTNSSMCGMAA